MRLGMSLNDFLNGLVETHLACEDFEFSPEALAAIEEGEADLAAGRVVSHERIREWVQSWGTEHELPVPRLENELPITK